MEYVRPFARGRTKERELPLSENSRPDLTDFNVTDDSLNSESIVSFTVHWKLMRYVGGVMGEKGGKEMVPNSVGSIWTVTMVRSKLRKP